MEAINRMFTAGVPQPARRGPFPSARCRRTSSTALSEKFVMQLEAQLADRNVTFELSEDAIKWLAEEGYDEKMGARPLGRVIQEHIKRPLADQVLFGDLKKGGTVKVTVAEDEDGKKSLLPRGDRRPGRPGPSPA